MTGICPLTPSDLMFLIDSAIKEICRLGTYQSMNARQGSKSYKR